MHVLALFLLVLLPGCASTPEPPVPTSGSNRRVIGMDGSPGLELTEDANVRAATLEGSPSSLWPALAKVYADLGLEVNTLSTNERMLGVQNARVRRIAGERPSRYIDCGTSMTGAKADHYDIMLTVLSQLAPSGHDRTEVRTQVRAYARDPSHTSGTGHCPSTGRLERRIEENLRAQGVGPSR